MFSRSSRYAKLPQLTSSDASGQPIRVAELRIAGPLEGKFQHRVEQKERIDSLAYKYYRDSGKWWRICDANPAFLSPDELLGQSPVVQDRIAVVFVGTGPPWAELTRTLAGRAGVESVLLQEEARLLSVPQTVLGELIDVVTEERQRFLSVRYNELSTPLATLTATIVALGFTLVGVQRQSRVGQPIIIPPEGG